VQSYPVALSRVELQERRRAAFEEWYEGLRESPDASVRLHALEQLAQRPGDTTEFLLSALGDEDDALRDRAEELVEQLFEREAEDLAVDEDSMEAAEERR
jgi:hypothetical protein